MLARLARSTAHFAIMNELVVIEVVQTEAEAELLCSRLRTSGLPCIYRLTNFGAAAFEGLPAGGPQEILVRRRDVEAAREELTGN